MEHLDIILEFIGAATVSAGFMKFVDWLDHGGRRNDNG